MKKTIAGCAIFIFAGSCCLSQPCIETQMDSGNSALTVLKALSPSETDVDSRRCISAAIRVVSQTRDEFAVPELIRYLTFQRDAPPEEAKGLFIQTRIEGDEYPAILALARIGKAARPQLLKVIESDRASETERNNAAHAIVLSFRQGASDDPGQSIRYIRDAEPRVDTASKNRLEQAVAYILTTPACSLNNSTSCKKAYQETSFP